MAIRVSDRILNLNVISSSCRQLPVRTDLNLNAVSLCNAEFPTTKRRFGFSEPTAGMQSSDLLENNRVFMDAVCHIRVVH